MIRILAFSDIHNNLECVDQLIAQVSLETFDCAVVAGDIGNKTAPIFFEKLSSLPFPLYYVYGNWDSKLAYDAEYSRNSFHLHQKIFQVGDYFLTGFSGCPAHWGNNPIYVKKKLELEKAFNSVLQEREAIKKKLRSMKLAAGKREATNESAQSKVYKREMDRLVTLEGSLQYRDYLQSKKALSRDVLHENKQSLFRVVSSEKNLDVKNLIIVTHERLSKLEDYTPAAPLLNMYGHIHKYSHQTWRDTDFINISHLDNAPVSFKKKPKVSPGNYCIVTISGSSVTSEKVDLIHS